MPTAEDTKKHVNKQSEFLTSGGFKLPVGKQHSKCYHPKSPKDARLDSIEHWFSQGDANHAESGLGFSRHWEYKH